MQKQKPQQLHLTCVRTSTARNLLILHEKSCWISPPELFRADDMQPHKQTARSLHTITTSVLDHTFNKEQTIVQAIDVPQIPAPQSHLV